MRAKDTVQRRSRMKRRADAIAAVGGACKACGESDHRLLELDHIVPAHRHGGAVKQNGQHNTNAINRMVREGLDPRAIYQPLCVRCHRLKTLENEDYIFTRETQDGR